MNNTCIQHPARDSLIVIRQWQLDFCEGNHCAAALLSFFEYWHNIRLDMSQRTGPVNAAARQDGKPATHDESLLQFHSDEQLHAGLLGLYGTMKIREARRLLVAKGVLTEHLNPTPRYAFDRTIHYLFHPEVVNVWLAQWHSSASPDQNVLSGDSSIYNITCAKNGERVAKNGERVAKNGERVAKNGDCSQETTTEITTEITTTTPNPSSTNERAAEPEAVERGGSVRDQTPESQDSNHGIAGSEPNEEKPVGREEVQAAATTDESGDIPAEAPAHREAAEEIGPVEPAEPVELVYPTKLTDAEREDIAKQVGTLPQEVVQQMLDVVQSQIQGGQVKKNPAAVLRGIVRKYHADPGNFDPSPGFHIADQRRHRAEAAKRLKAVLEARDPVPATLPLPVRQNGSKPRPAGLQALLDTVAPSLERAG